MDKTSRHGRNREDAAQEKKKESKIQALQHGRAASHQLYQEGASMLNTVADPHPQKQQPGRSREAILPEGGAGEAATDDPDENDGLDPTERNAFEEELRNFFKARGADFRIPRFYGVSVNLLKLWRLVCYHGGYDEVTRGKLWRSVGDHFNPPKSCTTLSWSFRIFYEKSLLDYERVNGIPELSNIGLLPLSLRMKLEGRPKVEPASAAAPALQGEGLLCGLPPAASMKGPKGVSSVAKSEKLPKDKNPDAEAGKGESSRKRPSSSQAPQDLHLRRGEETRNATLRLTASSELATQKKAKKQVAEINPMQPQALDVKPEVPKLLIPLRPGLSSSSPSTGAGATAGTSNKGKSKKDGKKPGDGGAASQVDQQPAVVWDIGEECSWVKVNVRRSPDCFEIYALVPGLLREEIKVQVEGPGRVIICGMPERDDNPWGVRPFKKIVVLPGAVLGTETTAVVALHGQLYIHLPLAVAGKVAETEQT